MGGGGGGVGRGGPGPVCEANATPGRLAGGSSLQARQHTPMGSGRKGSVGRVAAPRGPTRA